MQADSSQYEVYRHNNNPQTDKSVALASILAIDAARLPEHLKHTMRHLAAVETRTQD